MALPKVLKKYIINERINLGVILEWLRQYQIIMVSHKNNNLNVHEDFVIFLTSKLITCFIDGFTFGIKSQSITYFLDESAHLYWILDLEDEVHSI
jgi:hypothetical protein